MEENKRVPITYKDEVIGEAEVDENGYVLAAIMDQKAKDVPGLQGLFGTVKPGSYSVVDS